MINEDNFMFMSHFGSKNAILAFIKTEDYSTRYHTDRLNKNPFVDPSIVTEVKKINRHYTPSFHSHRLYDPSPELEDKAVSNYHDATAYFNHPKHTDDDLIRIYDKHPRIHIQNESIGPKFMQHLISKKDHTGLVDALALSKSSDAHEAAMDHIRNESVDIKKDGLKEALAGNRHLSKAHQHEIFNSTKNPYVVDDLIRNPNLDPDLAVHIVKEHPDLHELFKIHKKDKIQKYMAAFEEIKKANGNQDDQR